MAISSALCLPSTPHSKPYFSAADCRSSDSGARPRIEMPAASSLRGVRASPLILRFPPNFVRQLSIKARRNCSNIGLAQIVAASWSNGPPAFDGPPSAASSDASAVPDAAGAAGSAIVGGGLDHSDVDLAVSVVQDAKASAVSETAALFSSDGSLAVHAGTESSVCHVLLLSSSRFWISFSTLGRGITTDSITTPIVNTSAYWFNNSDELIDFKENRHASFEYGRYGNPTTQALEEKMRCILNAAYMILRGMKTLHLRVHNQNRTALRMAQLLEEHPKIIRVYYPGLPSHPEHHIAKRQMTGFGGVVSFEVRTVFVSIARSYKYLTHLNIMVTWVMQIAGDLNMTKKFVDSLKIPYIAPSFGGCESIVDQPAIMSYWDLSRPERTAKYGIKDNLVRFSFGVEGFEDLKADILKALEKI
ncbi:hypothetical protein GW17_00004078 [Ensete ventricosum]|nr:hypothetical protein GW17_00004078 [Ensete ventricosum]